MSAPNRSVQFEHRQSNPHIQISSKSVSAGTFTIRYTGRLSIHNRYVNVLYDQIPIQIVDVRDPPPYGACDNTMAYIADVTGFGVLVYDYRRNVAWRTQNKYFYPNPDNGTFTIRGESFDLMDGILGMSLSRKKPIPRAFGFHHSNDVSPSIPSDRYLFFHSLASVSENRVALGVLDNQTAWNQNPDFSPRSFVVRSRVGQSLVKN